MDYAQIIKSSFNMTIMGGMVPPLSQNLPIALPLIFSDVSNLKHFEGAYTPQNDYRYIFQGLRADDAPSWIMIVCDGQINLNMQSSSGSQFVQAVQRFMFLSTAFDNGNSIGGLFIDGRTTAPTPMVQGQLINYTIICGKSLVR